MTFRSRAGALVASAALASSIFAGGAAGAADAPEFVEQATYFICEGTTPVNNVNDAVFGESDTPTWGTERPTGGTGDTCGTASGTNGFDAMIWEGTYTGNLDTMAFELHQLAPQNAVYGDIAINVTLVIDGKVVRSAEIADPSTTVSDTGLSYRVDLGVKDLGLVDDPDGPGTVEHDIRFEVATNFTDSGAVVGWIWGSEASPAGITFNGSTSGTTRF